MTRRWTRGVGAALLACAILMAGCGADWRLGIWEPDDTTTTEGTTATQYLIGNGVLRQPTAATVANGLVYVADAGLNRVVVFDPALPNVATLTIGADSGEGMLDTPSGVAVNEDNRNLFVVDQVLALVKVYDSAGQFVRKWGEADAPFPGFTSPQGIAIDGMGALYVTDATDNAVYKFNGEGTMLTSWGAVGTADGELSGPGAVHVLKALSPALVLVADAGNHRIQAFGTDGSFQFAFGASGAGTGQFQQVGGLAGPTSKIYVTDPELKRIQRFSAAGVAEAQVTAPDDVEGFRDPVGLVYVDSVERFYAVEESAGWLRGFAPTRMTGF